MRRITLLYSKATAMSKGSDAAEESRKRPQDRPRGQGKGGGKMRPPSPVPSSPFELPSTHSSSEEEEEAEVEEETGGTSSSTSSRVWLRGPSTLPRRPIPIERRSLIRLDGDK